MRQTDRLLAAWHEELLGCKLLDGSSFNLAHSASLRADDFAFHRRKVRARFGFPVLGHDHFLEKAFDAQLVLQHR